MTKLFFALYTKDFKDFPSLKISTKRPLECDFNQLVRSSPIYEIAKEYSFSNIEKEYSGEVYLLYTNQPLEVISALREKEPTKPGLVFMYLSQGFASVVVFSEKKGDIENALAGIKFLIGFEKWEVIGNQIVDIRSELPKFQNKKCLDIELDKLGHEEQTIFSDIISSYNLAYTYSDALLPVYNPILEELERKILEFYYRSLCLSQEITFDEFEKRILELNSANQLYARELISEYKNYIANPETIEQVFIKDEIIQIASILKNSNSQLFGNIPVANHGMYQSGKNSLLGIGNHLLGILSIYLHLRECFNSYDFEGVFDGTFKKTLSPQYLRKPDSESYIEWYQTFIDSEGLNDFLKEQEINATHLIVYFSNRQGFRLTKHSVSAAMQSLYLSYLPSFTLNTLTHELLHAHVRAEIMVEFYPLVESRQGYNLCYDAYEKYRNVFKTKNTKHKINDFIKVNFLFIAGIIKENGGSDTTKRRIKKYYADDVLFKSLKSWYKEIEEIIVHILDLHYFYNSKSSLYVKAIWISWLTLPFSVHNLRDYILRTICSVSSLIDNPDRLERFKLSVEILQKALDEIKELDIVNTEYVDIVLSRLADQKTMNELVFYYTNAFVNLVDITKKYFFSTELKAKLNYDSGLGQETDNSYTLDLEMEELENRTIQSPIVLINEINNYNISNIEELNRLGKDEIEKRSSWVNSLIVSSLKKYMKDD